MSRLLKWLSPYGLMALCACTGAEQSADKQWGKAVAAPGSFFAEPGSEALSLPTSVAELNTYVIRTGAISDHRGPGEVLNAPIPPPRSICQPATEAVVFSYPLQRDGFMPSYTAYIIDGTVVCIDRRFSYTGP